MAWLEVSYQGFYQVAFRFGGRKYKKSTRSNDHDIAQSRPLRAEENLRLVETGRLIVPEDADLGVFLFSDGMLTGEV